MTQIPVARRRTAASSLLFILLIVLAAPAHGQRGVWDAHTSMRDARAVVAADDVVWSATGGGLFSYQPGTGEVRSYTAAEGLYAVVLESVAFDTRRQNVWIGYRSGVVDVLDVETGTVRTLRDIERAERFPTRGINRLVMHGDTVFAATDFGVVLFDAGRLEVRDSYTQFGAHPAGSAVHDVAVGPRDEEGTAIWVATEAGVASALLMQPNLKAPDVWTSESLNEDAPTALSLAHLEGRLYVGAEYDVWRRVDGGYERLDLTGRSVYDLVNVGDGLLGASQFNLLRVGPDGVAHMLGNSAVPAPRGLAVGDGNVWVGDEQAGLLAVDVDDAWSVTVRRSVVPEGPWENALTQMVVDPQGDLWAAGVRSGQAGFYRYEADGTWTNYRSAEVAALEGRGSYLAIDIDSRGHAWAGSWGGGVAEVTADGQVRVFDETNSSLRGLSINPSYVVADGVSSDADGNIWVTNKPSSYPLHVYIPDGDPSLDDWTAFRSHVGTSVTYGRIFVDSFGQKWIAAHNPGDLDNIVGVMVLTTGQEPSRGADDQVRFFNETGSGGVGLPSTHVNVVTEDRDGLIWVGTSEGPAYLYNTGSVPQDANAQFIRPQLVERADDETVFLLNGLAVHDIAVDPANRLWMATEEGAYLIEAEGGGYRIVEHFTAGNSPLFSDDVLNVAVNHQTGRTFFATDRGLVSYQGSAIVAEEQVQDLFVYPNPVFVTDGATPDVCVRGLVEETEVRVLRPDGTVVARSDESSGQFCWRGDAGDAWFRDVPSGVYIVAAVGRNGEGTAYGKVAVIR